MKSNLIVMGLLISTFSNLYATDVIKGDWSCEHINGDRSMVVIEKNYFDFINAKGAKLSSDMNIQEQFINFELALSNHATKIELKPIIRKIDRKLFSLNYTTFVDTNDKKLKKELKEGVDIISYYVELIKKGELKLSSLDQITGNIKGIASCKKKL